MQKTTAGEGRKTRTVKLDGELYQVRLVTCGKDGCKTCASQGGHVAVYHDTGAKGGARWQYVGSRLPEADPEYRVPVCECEGCDNEVKRRGQRFCSAKCRVKWHRAQG
jgi:hypothetical protein